MVRRVRIDIVLIFTSLFLLGVLVPHFTFAQLSGLSTDSSLTLSPSYPGPNTQVTVSLNAYAIDTVGASIRWFIDGAEATEVLHARELTVTTKALGEKTIVKAVVDPLSGAEFSLTKTILPANLDIIIEADTHVPVFYRGRALPSAESTVRAIAIPHVGGLTPSTLTYEWKLGERVLFGGPLRGKQSATFETPLYGGNILSVSVYDGNGTPLTARSMALENILPEIHFYENNPLRGVTERALSGTVPLVGEEITVRAEPYYVDREPLSSTKRGEWLLNGENSGNTSQDPYEITLRKTGGGGTALVEFVMTHTTKLFQNVRDSFTIYFE